MSFARSSGLLTSVCRRHLTQIQRSMCAVRPSGFLTSVLQNGVGRYVCQLQRLTFQFHKTSKGSHGIREFIEQDLVDFAKKNPGVVVYVTPHEKYRDPKIVAEFLNGTIRKVGILNKPRDDISQAVELLRTQSGRDIIKMRKWWHTDNPSIQGHWHPFTNRPTNLNIAEFPIKNPSLEVRSKVVQLPKDVADKLREELKSKKGELGQIQSGLDSLSS